MVLLIARVHTLMRYYHLIEALCSKTSSRSQKISTASEPNNVREKDWQTLIDAGFDEQMILELISIVSLADMFNTYAITYDVPVDSGYRRFPLERIEGTASGSAVSDSR